MATAIRLEVTGIDRLLRDLPKLVALQTIGQGLDEIAIEVRNDAAQNQIARGGKGPPLPKKLTSRTGTLRRSISVDTPAPLERDIGTALVYGRVHELGIRPYPKRSFLLPALLEIAKRQRPEVIMREVIRAAARKLGFAVR